MTETDIQLAVFPDLAVPESIPGEKLKHRNIFELYCRMGEKRNLRDLAKIVQTNEGCLFHWSAKYSWVDRVKKFDADIMRIMQQLTKEDLVAKNKQHIEIIDEAIKQWNDKLEAGQVSLNMVADMEKLLNIRARLSGQEALTSENQNNIQVNVSFV